METCTGIEFLFFYQKKNDFIIKKVVLNDGSKSGDFARKMKQRENNQNLKRPPNFRPLRPFGTAL